MSEKFHSGTGMTLEHEQESINRRQNQTSKMLCSYCCHHKSHLHFLMQKGVRHKVPVTQTILFRLEKGASQQQQRNIFGSVDLQKRRWFHSWFLPRVTNCKNLSSSTWRLQQRTLTAATIPNSCRALRCQKWLNTYGTLHSAQGKINQKNIPEKFPLSRGDQNQLRSSVCLQVSLYRLEKHVDNQGTYQHRVIIPGKAPLGLALSTPALIPNTCKIKRVIFQVPRTTLTASTRSKPKSETMWKDASQIPAQIKHRLFSTGLLLVSFQGRAWNYGHQKERILGWVCTKQICMSKLCPPLNEGISTSKSLYMKDRTEGLYSTIKEHVEVLNW